jgi:DNA polymerase elongation subunit (family B)
MTPYYSSFFRRGNKVFIREIAEDGERRNYSVEYKPKLYIPSDEPNCDYKTLDGEQLKEVEFSSISSARDYAKADSRVKLYGFNRWEYACINELYPQNIEYNMNDIRCVMLDIETCSDGHYSSIANPDQEIVLIQLLYKGTYYILGLDHYDNYEENVKFIRCKSEVELLKRFVQLFRKIDPDVITGWNSSGYDIPMLYSRMGAIGLEEQFKRLSPFNMINTYDDIVYNKPQLRVDIMGIQHLDYMNMIRKFDLRKFENYKLDTVGTAITGKGKVKYTGSMHKLYVTDYQKYVSYGIRDVELLDEIDRDTQIMELVILLGYKSKTNFSDAFYQVRMWDCTFYDYLKNIRHVQTPFHAIDREPLEDGDDEDGYEGAYVKLVVAGKYSWIVSDDVQSLYPSIMIAWNMSPETYAGKFDFDVDYFVNEFFKNGKIKQQIKDENVTLSANGAKFVRDYIGFIPEIINTEFNARVEAKDKMTNAKKEIERLNHLLASNPNDQDIKNRISEQKLIAKVEKIKQLALKVRINSAYGAIGNQHFRFYKREMAEAITLTGQVLLKLIDEMSNSLINNIVGNETPVDYVVAQDTDSNYIVLNDIVKKFVKKGATTEETIEFLDRYHKKYIAPEIKRVTDDMQNDMNVYEHRLKFVRDVIADEGIFLAKKRYALQVWDAEGVRYDKPDLKVMGIESVKSSTPQFCKGKINHSISIILNGGNEELISYIKESRNEFFKLPIAEIALPRGITDMDKWVDEYKSTGLFSSDDEFKGDSYISRTPIHVKGAIAFNNLIYQHNLTNKYVPITNGDKIKFVHLLSPNPISSNVLAFDDSLPEEFNLDEYVDKHVQYEKTLLSPIRSMADIIGWAVEEDEGAVF